MSKGLKPDPLRQRRVAFFTVEGPNGGGKSTLADCLKNRLRWDQANLHHRDGDQYLRYAREYGGRSSTVFVRGHQSEIVYSLLYGRATPFTAVEFDSLEVITELRGYRVLCLPPLDVLVERARIRSTLGSVDSDEQAKKEGVIEAEHILWQTQEYDYLYTATTYKGTADAVEMLATMVMESGR